MMMMEDTEESAIKMARRMPSPPDFLVKKTEEPVAEEKIAEEKIEWSLGSFSITSQPAPNEEIPSGVLHDPAPPVSVDFAEYQRALGERRRAEIDNAEIYDQCLAITALNEKLLRDKGGVARFKARVRKAYDKALKGDEALANRLRVTQIHLDAAERALNDMQIEGESLRISVESQEEAGKNLSTRLKKVEAEAEKSAGQFQQLVDEFENRGILLEEADRKIREYLAEMHQLNDAIRENQERMTLVRNENLSIQNKMRELQLRESGVSTLNAELARAVDVAQKQIHELEDRIHLERKHSLARITFLEQEMDRMRENLRAEALLDQARQFQNYGTTTGDSLEKSAPILSGGGEQQRPPTKSQQRAPQREPQSPAAPGWTDLYNRWSHIIDGLSSHSTPIDSKPAPKSAKTTDTHVASSLGATDLPPAAIVGEQLLSEGGGIAPLF